MVDLNYRGETYQGKTVIQVSLDGSYYEFDANPAADLAQYNWLEFYVKFIDAPDAALTVRLGHWTPEFHETSVVGLGALPSQYVVPDQNEWVHVIVPLSELFAYEYIEPGRIVNELGIIFGTNGCIGNGFTQPFGKALLTDICFVSSVSTPP